MPEDTPTTSEFREVFLVTFEPKGKDGGIGGLSWFTTREGAEAHYEALVNDNDGDYDDDIVALWNASVPTLWTNETVTDYLDDTFVGVVPDGFPLQANNAPSENWPHENDEDYE